jgi:DNA polymerase-3 subunit beta
MKLIISKTALEMAVKNICRVINSKNALPILGDVLCMVDEEKQTITMTGSDSEAWLTYQLQLQECEGGGPFCIGADLLRDALSELSEQPVTILATTESDMKLRLQHESGETVLPLENADEYPTPRHIDSHVNQWSLESGMLKRVLKRSMFATANDDLRPVMNGIYFDQCEDGDRLLREFAQSVAQQVSTDAEPPAALASLECELIRQPCLRVRARHGNGLLLFVHHAEHVAQNRQCVL